MIWQYSSSGQTKWVIWGDVLSSLVSHNHILINIIYHSIWATPVIWLGHSVRYIETWTIKACPHSVEVVWSAKGALPYWVMGVWWNVEIYILLQVWRTTPLQSHALQYSVWITMKQLIHEPTVKVSLSSHTHSYTLTGCYWTTRTSPIPLTQLIRTMITSTASSFTKVDAEDK